MRKWNSKLFGLFEQKVCQFCLNCILIVQRTLQGKLISSLKKFRLIDIHLLVAFSELQFACRAARFEQENLSISNVLFVSF